MAERLGDADGVERRGFEQLARRAAHEHDCDIGAGAGLLDELRGGFLGLREVRARARAGGHRVGVVEQDDERGLRAAEQRAHPGEDGPRHAEREQHGDEAADEKQEELLELEPPRVRLERGVEQVHRAPLHDARAGAVEEVQQLVKKLDKFKSLGTRHCFNRIADSKDNLISLSGLSGVAAGICALAGAFIAQNILKTYYGSYNSEGFFSGDDFSRLKIKLTLLGAVVFTVAFVSSFYLTWRKAKKMGQPIWNLTSKRLAWNMLLPLIAGATFILGMLRYDVWMFVSPASLIFYGLALVNASKYTLTDIRYLGYCEIVLGLINMFFIGYGLWFWAIGFGILHIVYGVIMWSKYERKA